MLHLPISNSKSIMRWPFWMPRRASWIRVRWIWFRLAISMPQQEMYFWLPMMLWEQVASLPLRMMWQSLSETALIHRWKSVISPFLTMQGAPSISMNRWSETLQTYSALTGVLPVSMWVWPQTLVISTLWLPLTAPMMLPRMQTDWTSNHLNCCWTGKLKTGAV